MNERPREIKASHLARKAVVYIRQSSETQVLNNLGSTESQRNQRRYAEAWGWAADRIDVIDDDLGLSGAAADHRPGYQRLLREIEEDLVGAVFVSDESRLGRDMVAKLTFANLCIAKRILLVLDGRVGDLADPATLLQTQLCAVFSQHENLRRCEHIRRGRDARLAAGYAVSAPPAGYVRTDKGKWEMHPDGAVQALIRLVFSTFRRERSYYRTVRALRQLGIKLPRQPPGKSVRFVDPTLHTLRDILTNPQYTGSYYYRRRVGDTGLGRDSRGMARQRIASADEMVIIENHHPAYATKEEWDEVQSILACNAPRRDRRNLGPGRALLQGIVECGRHRFAMSTQYARQRDRRDDCLHYYRCPGEHMLGQPECGSVAGHRLDRPVVEAVLARLSPPQMAALSRSLREHRREAGASTRVQDLAIRRMRREVEDLESHLLQVDPANRLVAARLEVRLELAMRELQVAETAHASARTPLTLTDADLEHLTRLCADVSALFHAHTTSHRDRKEILRTLVQRVIIDERSPEQLIVTVRWCDQIEDTVLRIRGDRYTQHRIAALAVEGKSVRDISIQLAQEGLFTSWGTAWTPNAVRMALHRAGRRVRSRWAARG